ncbi:MAG: hypothetical protein EXR62_14965 [Chloroflexi bacterium]|nr:hypothetical protein [Chloroflexota bacterium]
MGGFFRFLRSLVIGALMGYGLGLLIAPMSGAQFQISLNRLLDESINEGRKAAKAREAELIADFEAAKQGTYVRRNPFPELEE